MADGAGGGGVGSALRIVAVALAAMLAAPAARACTGDLDGDDRVVVAELITGIGAALGIVNAAEAAPFDANGDGRVVVNELVVAVAYALDGCPAPTPTATPMGGDAYRLFTIEPGDQRAMPDSTRTGFFTSALESANAAVSVGGGPLLLLIGTPGSDGTASLALVEDATLELAFLDDTCLCLNLLASTSAGTIDCDGGSAFDTAATRPDGSPEFTWTVTHGLGDAAPPGSAELLVMGRFERVSMPCALADCPQRGTATPPNLFAFTTANATAAQETAGPPLTLTVAGEPFRCDAFSTSSSGGMLAAPIPATIPPIGDVANVLRLAERP
jgi:hypothetical protein